MLFYSFFKTLVGKEVAVELKNDIVLMGTLVSVDQYLNIKLSNVSIVNADKYPQLVSN
jgi:U6 snRNA-associated Sm-like protein LSm2